MSDVCTLEQPRVLDRALSKQANRRGRGLPSVSVVIAAYNAAATIEETLASLQRQTAGDWEAVIVDDGSRDETATIVRRAAAADSRFRLVQQANGGVSAARNTGVAEARHDFLMFLDADDWIAPDYFERMLGLIAKHPGLDAAVCEYSRIDQQGRPGEPYKLPDMSHAFSELARTCPFAVHCCVFRKSLFTRAGGFDPTLMTCEDWDLWQRFARMGAKFGAVDAPLAFYRQRKGSLSRNIAKMVSDGFTVIARGHGRDPRVAVPDPRYAEGMPPHEIAGQPVYLLAWNGGVMIGAGGDARTLLPLIGDSRPPYVMPEIVADILADSIPIGAGETMPALPSLLPEALPRVKQFLDALAEFAHQPALALETLRALERKAVEHSDLSKPVVFSTLGAARVDLDKPVAAIDVPAPLDSVACEVWFAKAKIGVVQVPAEGRAAPADIAESVQHELYRAIAKRALTHPFAARRFWMAALGEVLRPSTYWLVRDMLQPRTGRKPLAKQFLFGLARRAAGRMLGARALTHEGPLPEALTASREAGMTTRLPVLMYHRIADDGPADLAQWRLAPAKFEEQLRYLREDGYRSCTLADWRAALATGHPLTGKRVLITFDDGYVDFLTDALPLLEKYGFGATVFLPVDKMGTSSDWDAQYGTPAPLMTWEQVQACQRRGIEFSSHASAHLALTGLGVAAIATEGARARQVLAERIGVQTDAIAYPYGYNDELVRQALRGAGYALGFNTQPGFASLYDDPMQIPRIEITGFDDLRMFGIKLTPGAWYA